MIDEPAEPETEDPSSSEDHALPVSTRSIVEWAAVIVGALVLALVAKTFLVEAFYIPSRSMVPTLEVGDRVLVNKLSYQFGSVGRGDVIVFDRPGGASADGISELIKRVVALGGETVEGRDGVVYVDGEPLDEGYLPEGTYTSTFGPEEIPDGRLWVMGDNREFSEDSRFFGTIPEGDVLGRAEVVFWPLGDIGRL